MEEITTRLENNLLSAKREHQAAVKQIANLGSAAYESFDRTHNAMMLAERELAAHLRLSYAVPAKFEKDWQWDLGSPSPTLIQTDNTVTLVYLLSSAGVDSDSTATVEFELCVSAKFGSPNDEVNEGHPLFGRGFEGYTALRVMNSNWISELQMINSVHPRYDSKNWIDLKHFIFGFHDSTFECVAKSFSVTTADIGVYEASKLALDKTLR